MGAEGEEGRWGSKKNIGWSQKNLMTNENKTDPPPLHEVQTKKNANYVSIFLCDIEMQLTSTALNSRHQGHLVTLPKYHCD